MGNLDHFRLNEGLLHRPRHKGSDDGNKELIHGSLPESDSRERPDAPHSEDTNNKGERAL